MKAFAVIPAYNEEKHIRQVIEKTKKHISPENIIIVDDGSKDNTQQEAEKTNVTILKHATNLGKGAALKTGCDYALKKGAEAIIALDSDGQHNPEQIPDFLNALKNTGIIFGYREKRKEMPIVLKLGNWLIDTLLTILFNIKIKDTQCGYRAFKSETYKKIRWASTDYSVESEMIARTGKHKIPYSQIQVETIYLDKYKGTGVTDGISIALKMMWWKLTR